LPLGLLALGALGTLLPWFRDSRGSVIGLSEADGVYVLAMVAVAAVLVVAGARVAWIPAGLATLIAARDVQTIADSAAAESRPGLWLTVVAVGAATLVLLGAMIREITRGTG
jgi:hypothetical protein